MKTITRTYSEQGEQILSEPIPADSLCNVWSGDTCTVYMPGDEAELAEYRASLPQSAEHLSQLEEEQESTEQGGGEYPA